MSDLFPKEEMAKLSPRLAWMQRHDINVLEPSPLPDGQECEITGSDGSDWIAFQGEPGPNNATNCRAPTREGALLKLASKLKITFYR